MRQSLRDSGPIEAGRVSGKSRPLRIPHAPWRVLHFVFEAAAARLRGVAPVMFRDELACRALRRKETRPFGFDPNHASIRSRTPRIFGFVDGAMGAGFNCMRHGHARIVFMECKSGDER